MKSKETEKYLKAKKRLEELKGFYWHLFAGVLVIPILIIVNYLSNDFPWAIFPIVAFLLSVLIHWFVVFKSGSIFSKEWERRKIQELMDEDEKNHKQLYK